MGLSGAEARQTTALRPPRRPGPVLACAWAAMSSERKRSAGSYTSLTSISSSAPVASIRRASPAPHRVRPANHGCGQKVANGSPLLRLQARSVALDGREQAPAVARQDAQHPLVGAAGQVSPLRPSGQRSVARQWLRGAWAGSGGAVQIAVQVNRLVQHARRKVRGKGIRQPRSAASWTENRLDPSSQIGTLVPAPGMAIRRWPGSGGGQQALQFGHVARKVFLVSTRLRRSARMVVGVGAGRVPGPRSMRPGVQLGQRAEGLSHHQRGMVGHHAAGPHADARGATGNVAHQHSSGGAGNAEPCCGAWPASSGQKPSFSACWAVRSAIYNASVTVCYLRGRPPDQAWTGQGGGE